MNLFVVAIMIAIGWFVGRAAERRHYASIRERESKFASQPAVTFKSIPEDIQHSVQSTELVYGSVVISVDYFKRLMAHLRNIFGGEMTHYAPLLDRGRREALLRMKERVPNATMYVNTRLTTSRIGEGRGKLGSVEVTAYGTAVTARR